MFGQAALSTSTQTKVTLGFKPKYLAFTLFKESALTTATNVAVYNEDWSTTKYIRGSGDIRDLNTTGQNLLYSIDSDGFTYNSMMAASSGLYMVYCAIK